MKCKMDDGNPSCRRCARAGVECIFKPRANVRLHLIIREQSKLIVQAAQRNLSPISTQLQPGNSNVAALQSPEVFQSVLARLDTIEAFVGLNTWSLPAASSTIVENEEPADPALAGLWESLALLRSSTHQNVKPEVWSNKIVKELWLG